MTNGEKFLETFHPYTRNIFGDKVYVYFTVEDCISKDFFKKAQIYRLDWWNSDYVEPPNK